MILALWTVPRVVFSQSLSLSKLLKAVLQRLWILDGLVVSLCHHARVIFEVLQIVWLVALVVLREFIYEKHDFELEYFVSTCLLFVLLTLFVLFFRLFLLHHIIFLCRSRLLVPIIVKPVILDLLLLFFLWVRIPLAYWLLILILAKERIIFLEFGLVASVLKEIA